MDDDGFIFLGYDADMDDEAEFIWRRNYTEPIDSSRAHEGTKTDGYGCSRAACTPAFTFIRKNAVDPCPDVILDQNVNIDVSLEFFKGEHLLKYSSEAFAKY